MSCFIAIWGSRQGQNLCADRPYVWPSTSPSVLNCSLAGSTVSRVWCDPDTGGCDTLQVDSHVPATRYDETTTRPRILRASRIARRTTSRAPQSPPPQRSSRQSPALILPSCTSLQIAPGLHRDVCSELATCGCMRVCQQRRRIRKRTSVRSMSKRLNTSRTCCTYRHKPATNQRLGC
jgi:hypothetical protein